MTKDFHGWRKSRHSEPNGGCIEAGRAIDGTIGVRDTKLGDLRKASTSRVPKFSGGCPPRTPAATNRPVGFSLSGK